MASASPRPAARERARLRSQQRQWGLVSERVVVHMLGGDGEVTIDGDTVTLAGPAGPDLLIADIEVTA